MFQPRCTPILIGSLPLENHRDAAELILEHTPEIPLWPQLPKRPFEGMVRQFLSGFPGLIDEGKRFFIHTDDPDFPLEMTHFYEEYLVADIDQQFLATSRFSLGNDSAPGFATLIELLKEKQHSTTSLKGQVTGPITTGIGTRDSQGNSIFFDDNLRDMLVKHLSLKARWQVIELKKLTGVYPPIIFIDEPAMVSFGSSAFAGVTREMATQVMAEVIDAIKSEGGLAGVHICANGDWAPVLASGADILSFDAYSFFSNLILFKSELSTFIQRGGILAWGIIPTGDPDIVAREDSESLFNTWHEQLNTLADFGFSKHQLISQTLISPACGTGSLTPELAIKVLSMTNDVAKACQEYL